MSSDQSSVNAQTVEQTKQQIRGLVSEIATLSKSDLSPEEFYAAFLQRIVSALAAVGGAVWLVGEGRQLELAYQINLSDTLLDEDSDATGRHMRLLQHVVRGNEPQLVPPLAGSGDETAGSNPTRFLLVLAPMVTDKQIEGVVEIFQRPNAQPATQRGYLRFLVQMCELAADWLRSRKLQQFSDRHSLWAQADEFSRLAHESLDLRDASYTIVNEARRLIGCDRVSIAIKRGPSCKVEAVSGQDTLENRSNIIASLNALATRVVATGEPLWYEGSTEHLPPQVEEALDHYVDESYAKSVVVLPLRRPDRPDEVAERAHGDQVERDHHRDREVFGALIVEQIETDLPREVIHPRIDLVYEHSARALANSLEHNSIFLMPVWRTIGKSSILVKTRNLPKTLLVAAVVLTVLIGLFAVRTDFSVEAPGELQPKKRANVYFGIDGTVEDVLVEDGQLVEEGQKLVVLTNHELEQRWQKIDGEIREVQKQLSSIRERLTRLKTSPSGRVNPADEAQLAGDFLRLQLREAALTEQLRLLDVERERLIIKSPIAGRVLLPWDAKQTLLNRPVAAIQKAMTIADPSGEWELELHMPERRIGHVRTARNEIKPDLDVTYILATDPGSRRHGDVREVYSISQVKGEDGPTVKILVNIDKQDLLEELRPGATVTADVNCGRSSVFHAWFHEAVEWFQKHVMF